jgi:hypothetical protein
MIGSTQIRRFQRGLVLATAAAALSAPAGFAVVYDRTGHDFPSAAVAPGVSHGFQTDTVNSARVARGKAGSAATFMQRHYLHKDRVAASAGAGALDPAIATAIAAHEQQGTLANYRVPGGFQTDTVNSARLAPVVERVPSGGFDWGSFGIGIGAGIGGLLLLGGLATRVRPQRRLANA